VRRDGRCSWRLTAPIRPPPLPKSRKPSNARCVNQKRERLTSLDPHRSIPTGQLQRKPLPDSPREHRPTTCLDGRLHSRAGSESFCTHVESLPIGSAPARRSESWSSGARGPPMPYSHNRSTFSAKIGCADRRVRLSWKVEPEIFLHASKTSSAIHSKHPPAADARERRGAGQGARCLCRPFSSTLTICERKRSAPREKSACCRPWRAAPAVAV